MLVLLLNFHPYFPNKGLSTPGWESDSKMITIISYFVADVEEKKFKDI